MSQNFLSQDFISQMPYFIAINYEKFLQAKTSKKQVELALHIYNLGLRTLTLGLVNQYLIYDREKVSDSYLNELLLQKFPHLTLDTWQQILFSTLKAYEGKNELFFMPELYDLYWDTSTLPHRIHADIERIYTRLTQISIEIKTKRLFLQDEKGWEKLSSEVKDLLNVWLNSLVFIRKYDLIRVIDYDETIYSFELHKGLELSISQSPLSEDADLHRDWFYLRSVEEKFLLLHPLFVFWKMESNENDKIITDVGIYDRFIYEKLQYLLAILGKTIVDQTSVKAFLTLLFETIEDVKRQRQITNRLTWWQLCDISKEITNERMATIYHKYQRELYLQRNKTRQEFEKFLKSDARCFVLIGKSGVGKSNFLLSLTEELQEARENVCLLMYDGANLRVDPSITATITQDFNDRLILEGRKFQQIWHEIVKIEKIEERLVILCIDAVNEHLQAKELLRQIDELVQKPWAWLKIVFTSRPETWQSIKRGIKLAEARYYRTQETDSVEVMLEPFSYSEKMEPFSRQELPEAYANYQQMFDLRTPYDGLSNEAREMLREPLNLWLVAKTYKNSPIPESLKVFDLLENYINYLVQGGRLNDEDLRLLEKRLIPLFINENRYTNTITMRDVDAVGDELYELIVSEQKLSDGQRANQSFVNLLDADILVKQGEGRHQKFAFKYERFYEYFVGRRIFELSQLHEERFSFFSDLIDKTDEVSFLWGAVKNSLLQEIKLHCYEVIFKLCFTEKQRVKEMMTNVLLEYSEVDRDSVATFLKQVIKIRRKTYLKRFKEDERENNAKRIVMEVASRLGILEVLEIAANDPSASIRTITAQQIYYLWRRNREQGLVVLKRLVENSHNRWKLPNMKILETFAGALFMIFLQHYEDKAIAESLRLLGKEMIGKLLYIGRNEEGILKSLLREWIIGGMIRFGVHLTRYDRHNTVNMVEFKEFFKLPLEEKLRLRKILSYLDPEETEIEEIEEIEDNLLAAAKTGDIFISYAMYSLLILHGALDWEKVKPIILKIFEIAMGDTIKGNVPHIGCVQMLNVPAGILLNQEEHKYKEDMIARFQEMTTKVYNKSNGQFHVKEIYFGSFLSHSAHFSQNNDNIDESLWGKYCLKAIEEKNEEFLLDLIWDLRNLALGFKQPQLALQGARLLLSVDIPSVHSALLHFIASVWLRYPDDIEDFLTENSISNEMIERIKSTEVIEEFGTLIHIPWTRFFAGLSLSSTWRKYEIEIYDRAVDCKNFTQWLGFVWKKIVNAVYGEHIFRV